MNSGEYREKEEERDFFESFDLERFWYVLKRSKYWILGFFVIIVSSAYLYVRYTKPLYKSESVIKLEFQSEANVLGLANVNTQEFNQLSSEIELIRSRLFFSRVVDAAELGVSYHLYGRYLTDERYKNSPFIVSHKILNDSYYDYPFDLEILNADEFNLIWKKGGKKTDNRYRFGEEIKTDDFNFLIEKTDYFSEDLEGDYYFTVNSRDALINYLIANVQVVPENLNAKTIKISLADHNRYKARDLVNLIDVLYISYTQEVKNQALEQKLEFLDEQIQRSEKKLQEYENYFEEFTIENRTTDLNQDLSRTIEQLALLDSQRYNLKVRIADVAEIRGQIELDALTGQLPMNNALPASLNELLTEFVELSNERELKLASYNESSYIIQQLDLQLEKARGNLLSLISGYEETLNDRLSLVQSWKSSLESNLSQLPSMRTEFGKTNRVYSLEEEFMLSLQQSKIELEITRAGTVSDNVILSPASLPGVPIKPEKLLIMAASVVMGLVVGIVFLLIRYLAHTRVAGIRELERLVHAPILGTVPRYQKKDLEITTLVVGKDSKSSLSESLRTIRTNMDFINSSNGTKLISITSTVPGEGKTFVAANLGAILAMSNKKVCIVDLDMRRPKVHLALRGKAGEHGVSTILAGKSKLKDSIQKTEINNLYFIPVGPIPPNPSELMMHKEFDQLIEGLKKEFDIIFLDTPPVGVVTDARLAMVKSDIQLYIFRADYSKRSFAKVINDLKNSNKFENLSVILNAISISSGYEYGYGSYNHYYQDTPKPSFSSLIKSLF